MPEPVEERDGSPVKGGQRGGEIPTEGVVPTVPRPVTRDEKGRFVGGSGRPSKRRPGAPLGNLSACKSPVSRAVAFWRRKALRPQDRWILPLLEDYRTSLVGDRGGDPSAAELHIITLASVAHGCQLLLLSASAEREGGLAGSVATVSRQMPDGRAVTMRKPDVLSSLARFQKVELTALRTLGLERRARVVDPLQAVRDAVARANATRVES